MKVRASKRIPMSLEASLVRGDKTYKAVIVGMSENGLYVIGESDARELVVDGVGTLTAKFNATQEQAFELECKLVWSDKQVSKQGLQKIGLEISNPTAEFKKFYRSTFYKVKKEISHDTIAVVGMACHYPGAPDLKSFWENILARRRAFRRLPDRRLPIAEYYDPDPFAPDKTYADRAAVIDGFKFDWVKRGIPKSVVDSSDIVHWLALDQALGALEDAGYTRENIPTDRTGVILGNTLTGEYSRSQQMRLRWPYVEKVLRASALERKVPPTLIDELLGTMEVRYKSSFAPVTEDTLAGNLSNTIAGRICNFLDLHGGGYTVDGACSSSLIAVVTAANALSTGTLDLAVAGGIDISLDTFELIGFAKTNALTREDMRVYDRRASGFIPGEGAGFVVLKRLQDARKHGNFVYATLRGWGISSDGKGGMTAPKAKTQALAIRRAYGKAGYGLESVDFIEGHGTGTMAGDKAELEGIADAMGDGYVDHLRPCGITSLKSLIGHTKAASGVGGFIKAVMAVNRRVVPPTAGCREPNPVFEEKAHGLYPVLEGEVRSPDDSMRAGVSGMGFGGINCHVTVESADGPAERIRPSIGERELVASYQETELFVVSAGSSQEMVERISHLKEVAEGISSGEMVDLSKDLADNLSEDAPFRAAMIAGNPEGLVDCLGRAQLMLGNDIPRGGMLSDPHQDVWVGNAVSRARVGFLFPGQGSQQLNMGRTIVERHAWAREFMEEVDTWLVEAGYEGVGGFIHRPLDRAIDKAQIDGWKADLSRTSIAQPAICMTSLLWMRWLGSLGITPAAVGGHSLGELTAFHAAGAFDEKSLVRFAAFRGRVTSADDGNAGIMAGLACDRDKVEEFLKDVEGYAVVANVNGPAQTVISGERAAVEKAVRLASMREIKTKILPVTNAFHSRFMSGAADELLAHAPVPETLGETKVRLLTSMDGSEVKPGTDIRSHFARQATHPVDFTALVGSIARDCDLLVEAGPGRVLSDLVKSITGSDGTACLPVEARAGDDRSLNVFLGCYFVRGGRINWSSLFENRLVRPFIPASKRSFIENPCERSFVAGGEEIHALRSVVRPNTVPAMSTPSEVEDETGLFSRQQVDYIRRLINAETLGRVIEIKGQGSTVIADASSDKAPSTDGTVEAVTAPGGTRGPDMLIELASEMTGFPKGSITLAHRLLDDLNLDSIKAGQFAARAVKLYHAEAKQLDPTSMANSSLEDIYGLLKQDQPSNPAGEMTAVDEQPDAEPAPASALNSTDNWVRDSKVVYVEEPRVSPYSLEQMLAVMAEKKRHVLIVSDDEADGLSSGMQNILAESGVAATSMDYGSLGNRAPDDCGRYDYFVFLLPRTRGAGLPADSQVLEMASRMHCIGKVITSLRTQVPKPSYAVVQFGDGGLHRPDGLVSMVARGSSAFLGSLHLENPDERMRVLQFSDADDSRRILLKIAEELRASDGFAASVYDSGFTRRIPVLEPVRPGTFKDRAICWTPDDVVLVTGGARGITAECALAFAVKNRVKLAVVGSTVLVDRDEEVQKSFARYRENGVVYRYYACDIADKEGVADLVRRVERDLGPITGVIHGAAVNKPRRFELGTLDEAKAEIAPKLMGAINILECLKQSPPKLFVGFGSIIGITGMAGNAWYAFANETLGLLLSRFKADTGTEVITPAFSVWDEVGMGTRLGTIGFLAKMGIHTIPKEKGVQHFMRLVDGDPGEEQVVVSSRLGNLNLLGRPAARDARFLENVMSYESGVEIEARAVLTPEKDPYLNDHVFRGTCLLPTVFGVEAMAQAVSAVTGTSDIGYLRLEDIQLKLPITVEPGGATEIRIQALVDEDTAEDGSVRVKAGIAVEQTNFAINHFEATFVLGARKELGGQGGDVPGTFLDIVPEEDLYGHMLFQGKTFQRIKAVRSLDGTGCVFDAVMGVPVPGLLTKDPYFRDTLLQSVQLVLPDIIALPVGIDRWETLLEDRGPGPYTVVVDSVNKDKEFVTADVCAIDASGRVVERLHGYKTKIVGLVQDAPGVLDLVDPDGWDVARLNDRLQHYCRGLGVESPAVSLKHRSGLHAMKKVARHALEKDLFEKTYRELRTVCEGLPDELAVSWTKDGKPIAKGAGISLSCSHDDRLCLCTAGRGIQGSDVEPMADRTAEEWRDMLGAARLPLLKTVADLEGSADRAGSRIWCALEAARKATGASDCELRYRGQVEDCVTFTSGEITVMTFPIMFLRGRERMVAVATTPEEAAGPGATADTDRGPRGQKVSRYQLPLGLRDSATVGGEVYFASYFHWLGKVREMSLKPIGRYIADEFHNGHFMVTNFSETDISGHVGNHEVLDARVWVDKVLGDGSSLMLRFDWLKAMPDGKMKRVASSRQQVSWIRVVGHGVVEPVPSPPYFSSFLRDNGFLPEGDDFALEDAGVPEGRYPKLGKVLREGSILGEGSDVLEESVIDTTMEHSNLAQNIYFSNYFTWQGQLRDRYIFNLSPGQYRKMGREGQFVCIHSRVKHLRDALPFDRILVTMKLGRVYERGLDLYFEYFKLEPDDRKVKLAYGEHVLAWVKVDGSDDYVPQGLPAVYAGILSGDEIRGPLR